MELRKEIERIMKHYCGEGRGGEGTFWVADGCCDSGYVSRSTRPGAAISVPQRCLGICSSRIVLKERLYRGAWKDLSEQLQQAEAAETGDIMFPEQKDIVTTVILVFQETCSARAAKLSTRRALVQFSKRRKKK